MSNERLTRLRCAYFGVWVETTIQMQCVAKLIWQASIQVAFWWFSARHIHIQVSLSYKNIILRHSVRCQMCVLSPVEKLLQPVNFLKWDIELSVLQSETRKNNNSWPRDYYWRCLHFSTSTNDFAQRRHLTTRIDNKHLKRLWNLVIGAFFGSYGVTFEEKLAFKKCNTYGWQKR